MAYEVRVSPAAARDLKKQPRDVQRRLGRAIDGLADNPRPHGVEKLTDQEDLYRIREGDYRIIYRIGDAVLVVLVVAVGDRKEIYRRFK